MKTNPCVLPQDTSQLEELFAEVDKCAAYNRLPAKQKLQLRLLAEELTGMLPALLKWSKGEFWMENEGAHYELHVSLTTFFTDIEQRDRLLAVSSSGKNAAAVGIMGKIRCAVEEAMLAKHSAGAVLSSSSSIDLADSSWTLKNYRAQVERQSEAEKWDELEKSIIANLADDVVVGIRSDHVHITVTKTFWAA